MEVNGVCERCGNISGTAPCLCVFEIKEETGAYRCPVCLGRRVVDSMFYKIPHDGPISASSVTNIQCKSCEGKGYVIG